MKLEDLGERAIIQNVLMKEIEDLANFDDDCAILPFSDQLLLLSTDPAPEPIAFQFGYHDYYYYGWLTAVVNVSDIAAMGGVPLGLLMSTTMPSSMSLSDYQRFIAGVKDACQQWSCPILGGNIKDSKYFSSHGFIIGKAADKPLLQDAARPGDAICLIGDPGNFWLSVIIEHHKCHDILAKHDKERLFKALTKPYAKLREGQMLATKHLASSCTDVSDGITWSLINMASKSGLDFFLDSSSITFDAVLETVCDTYNYSTLDVWLSGGDYNLVCTVRKSELELVREEILKLGSAFHVIGCVRNGNGKAWIENEKHESVELVDKSSERFSKSSQFSYGYCAYLDYLKSDGAS